MNKKKKYFYLGRNQFCIVWLVLVIEIAVILGINIMNYSEKKIELLDYKYNSGSYTAYFSKDLDQEKIDLISRNITISNMGILTYYKQLSNSERQHIWIRGANENYILRNSIIEKGRMPENRNEVIAEEWVFRNLGIEATPGIKFQLHLQDIDKNKSTEEFTVAGVLNDNNFSKEHGEFSLFIPFSLQDDFETMVYIDYKQGVDISDETIKIFNSLPVGEQEYAYSEEADEMNSHLYQIHLKDIASSIMIAICAGIFLIGMFRIALERQLQEIGILRACGYSLRKIRGSLFSEFSILYLSAVPIGFLLGVALTRIIQMITGIDKIQYIFWGQLVSIDNSYPWKTMVVGILVTGCIVFSEFLYIIHCTRKHSIVKLVKGDTSVKNLHKHTFSMDKLCRKFSLSTALAVQRICFRKGISLLIMLSLCCSGTLFLVLDYKMAAESKVTGEVYFQSCQNADITLNEYNDETILTGITGEELRNIKELKGVRATEAALVLPIRIVLDDQNKIAKKYYDLFNVYAKDLYFKEYSGKEKRSNEYVLKSSLLGFNREAMKKLEQYVIEGEIDYEKMSNSNSAVVFIPQYQEGHINQKFIKNGEKAVNYEVGDSIKMKYRSDYNVEENGYWNLEDMDGEYKEETFTIGAIVYYPYLENTSKTGLVNPDIIVSEDWMGKNTNVDVYTTVNVQLETESDGDKVEDDILKIMSNNHGVIVTNLINAKLEKNIILKKEQVFSILWIMIVFTGMLSCIANCIKYNTLVRKKDYAVLRALGMPAKAIQKSVRIEGLIYGICSSIIVLAVSYSIQLYLFQNTGLKAFGLPFWLHEGNKAFVILFNLIVSIGISDREIQRKNNHSIVSMLNREE